MSQQLPTPEELQKAQLVRLANKAHVMTAQRNGWPIFYFADGKFYREPAHMYGVIEYANPDWREKHVPTPVPPTPAPPVPTPPPVTPPTPPTPPAPPVVPPAPPVAPPIPPVTPPPVTPPVTPPPIVTPPAVVYPSGEGPGPVPAGYTRGLFEDFVTAGIDYTVFGEPAYQGTSYSSQNGFYATSHAVQKGDSLLRLQMYPDLIGGGVANGWVGAGLQTSQAKMWPVGSIYTIRTRCDSLAGATPIDLVMGKTWPPEVDIDEGGETWLHWGQGNANHSGFTIPIADDDTNWHTWQLNLGAETITVSCDGVVFGSIPNPDAGNTDPYGLLSPMFLSLQYQTGDPNNPAPDPTRSAANPYEKQVDWITIDVPSSQFGVNDHFLMWSQPSDYPIAIMQNLGVKVCRNDLYGNGKTSSFTAELASSQTIATVQTWAAALKDAGIQPMIVVDVESTGSLPNTAQFAADFATLVKACPGIWWEIGNELDGTDITADVYVPFFSAVVAAAKAADFEGMIGPAPVGDINDGGNGWKYVAAMFTAGLTAIPYDFFPFHNYPWPTATDPTVPIWGPWVTPPSYPPSLSSITCIPYFMTQASAWGNTKPYIISECGYQDVDTSVTPNMTGLLQATYVVEMLKGIEDYELMAVLLYELGDGGGQTYGLYTAGWATPKPVVAALKSFIEGA